MEKSEKQLYNVFQIDEKTQAITSKDGIIITLKQGDTFMTLTLASLRELFKELK